MLLPPTKKSPRSSLRTSQDKGVVCPTMLPWPASTSLTFPKFTQFPLPRSSQNWKTFTIVVGLQLHSNPTSMETSSSIKPKFPNPQNRKGVKSQARVCSSAQEAVTLAYRPPRGHTGQRSPREVLQDRSPAPPHPSRIP